MSQRLEFLGASNPTREALGFLNVSPVRSSAFLMCSSLDIYSFTQCCQPLVTGVSGLDVIERGSFVANCNRFRCSRFGVSLSNPVVVLIDVGSHFFGGRVVLGIVGIESLTVGYVQVVVPEVQCTGCFDSSSFYLGSFVNHVGADEMPLVGLPSGSIEFPLQPAIIIPLTHGEGETSCLSVTVVVAILDAPTFEVPDISTPVINVVLNTGKSAVKGQALDPQFFSAVD